MPSSFNLTTSQFPHPRLSLWHRSLRLDPFPVPYWHEFLLILAAASRFQTTYRLARLLQKRVSMQKKTGPILAVVLTFIIVASTWLFMQRRWWMPELGSIHGADIDRVFLITLVISGVLFILLQGVVAYFAFRYGDKGKDRARYWIRPGLEKRFALIAGIIIFGVDVTIYALGESQWFKAWGPSPPGTPIVEVMGEQFVWNFRYPGPDGLFGKTDAMLISPTNPFGIDKADPANADDIVSINQLHLPEGKPVRLRIRSHDVIHSFFLPFQRVKQDAVPGMQVELWFVPNRAGKYEIACSQLCGLGHYRMQGQLTVEPQDEFDKWLHETAQGGS